MFGDKFAKQIVGAIKAHEAAAVASQPKETLSSEKQINSRSITINNSGVRYNNNPMVDVNAEKWKGLV